MSNKIQISEKKALKRVWGVYDSCICLTNTYTPPIHLIHNLLYPIFHQRVCVWRLILKKKSLVISTLQFRGIYIKALFFLFCSSSLALLHLRSSFASKPLQIRFIEWAKNGSCIEFGRDLQGRCIDVNIFNAKTRRHKELFLEHGKHRINEINARLMWY